MEDDEVPDDSIERSVLERQPLGVGLAKLDVWSGAPRQRHHLVRHIDADNARPARHRGRSDIARTRAHIEHAASGRDPGCTEQRLDYTCGDRAKEPMIRVGTFLPPCGLESVEAIRVKANLTHAHLLASGRGEAVSADNVRRRIPANDIDKRLLI